MLPDSWARTLATTGRVEFPAKRLAPALVLVAAVIPLLLFGVGLLLPLEEGAIDGRLLWAALVGYTLFVIPQILEYSLTQRGRMVVDSLGIHIPGWPPHDISWNELAAVRATLIWEWPKVHVAEAEVSHDYLRRHRASRSKLFRAGDLLNRPTGDGLRIPARRGTAEALAAWLNEEAVRRSPRAAQEQASLRHSAPATPSRSLSPEFPTTRLSEGYDQQEVDAFVASLRERMAGPPSVTADEIKAVRFTPRRFRTAYSMPDVDAYLDDLAHELSEVD